tara:strand:+ start:2005 stop:2106 length:102 start_codon:yes stop_codon:yes gene_type:complete
MDEYGRDEQIKDAIGCILMMPLGYALLVLMLCM